MTLTGSHATGDSGHVADHNALDVAVKANTASIVANLGMSRALAGAVAPTRYVGGTISGAPSSGTFAVGDFAVTADGHLFICTVAGSPGTWVDPAVVVASNFEPYVGLFGDLVASGEETMPREQVTGFPSATASGQLRLAYFTSRKTETISKVRTATGPTGAGAKPTLCRIGIYSEDPVTGNLTLVGSIANDTTLFGAANTVYTRNLTSSFTKQRGTRYAFGVLVVTSLALPKLVGLSAASAMSGELAERPRLAGQITQNDLPSAIAATSLSPSGTFWYGRLLP
jgi:hypothetical protein